MYAGLFFFQIIRALGERSTQGVCLLDAMTPHTNRIRIAPKVAPIHPASVASRPRGSRVPVRCSIERWTRATGRARLLDFSLAKSSTDFCTLMLGAPGIVRCGSRFVEEHPLDCNSLHIETDSVRGPKYEESPMSMIPIYSAERQPSPSKSIYVGTLAAVVVLTVGLAVLRSAAPAVAQRRLKLS